MTDNNDSKKISGVESSSKAKSVEKTQNIAEVSAVKAASGVGALKGATGISANRRATRLMTAQEREQLLKMVDDEAEKLMKAGSVPSSQKELIAKAVKMAVDSSIILKEDVKE